MYKDIVIDKEKRYNPNIQCRMLDVELNEMYGFLKGEKMNSEVFQKYPKVDSKLVHELLEKEIKRDKNNIVVLDDDPTGVQTVHNISVYTDWSAESIQEGFRKSDKMFFILTNSRSFTMQRTEEVHREIARNISKASEGVPFLVVSRSDSTLRGHYPLETEVLKNELEKINGYCFDGEILCPYFAEGNRFTLENVHYVRYGNTLVPAGETEFAKDKTFGYTSSDLREYVEEKSKGKYQASNVICISLDSLRAMDYEKIEEQLMEAENFCKIIVNAIEDSDVEIFVTALYRAIQKGKHYLFRTAAAFVKALGGINSRPLLERKEMIREDSCNGGLIMIGSHTEKTTKQLKLLMKIENIQFLEFNSDLVLDEVRFQEEIKRVIEQVEFHVKHGITTAVYTRRKLLELENDTKEAALLRSVRISEAVQSIVGKLNVRPAFLIAKGGITSSDIGVKALRVKKALVLGQIQPGIPVWKTGEESKFPGIPYVIFPGNVGDEDSLYKTASILMNRM